MLTYGLREFLVTREGAVDDDDETDSNTWETQSKVRKYIAEMLKKQDPRTKGEKRLLQEVEESTRDELLCYIRTNWNELPLAHTTYYGKERYYSSIDQILDYKAIVSMLASAIHKALFDSKKTVDLMDQNGNVEQYRLLTEQGKTMRCFSTNIILFFSTDIIKEIHAQHTNNGSNKRRAHRREGAGKKPTAINTTINTTITNNSNNITNSSNSNNCYNDRSDGAEDDDPAVADAHELEDSSMNDHQAILLPKDANIPKPYEPQQRQEQHVAKRRRKENGSKNR